MKFLIFGLSFLVFITNPAYAAKHVIVDGSFQKLDLKGWDGTDGRSGYGCEDGDDGEDGRNGEDAYLYYENLADLKNIQIDNSGGLGGDGGRSGYGVGCDSYPSSGQDGDDGFHGAIYLVKGKTELPKEKLYYSKINLEEKKTLKFLDNEFKSKKNVDKLLHAKSSIGYSNFEFQKTSTYKYSLKLANGVNAKDVQTTVSFSPSSKKFSLQGYKNSNYISNVIIKFKVQKNVILITEILEKEDFKNTEFISVIEKTDRFEIKLKDKDFANSEIDLYFGATLLKYSRFIDHYVMRNAGRSYTLLETLKSDERVIEILKDSKDGKILLEGGKFKLKAGLRKIFGNSSFSYSKEFIFTL